MELFIYAKHMEMKGEYIYTQVARTLRSQLLYLLDLYSTA